MNSDPGGTTSHNKVPLLGWATHEIDVDIDLVLVRVVLLR